MRRRSSTVMVVEFTVFSVPSTSRLPLMTVRPASMVSVPTPAASDRMVCTCKEWDGSTTTLPLKVERAFWATVKLLLMVTVPTMVELPRTRRLPPTCTSLFRPTLELK